MQGDGAWKHPDPCSYVSVRCVSVSNPSTRDHMPIVTTLCEELIDPRPHVSILFVIMMKFHIIGLHVNGHNVNVSGILHSLSICQQTLRQRSRSEGVL